MLTSAELAQARADAAETLVDSATIKRSTPVNTYGIADDSFATVTTVACRIDPMSNRVGEPYAGEREAARTYFILTLPYDTTINDGDRVTINSEDYEVLTLHKQHSYRLMVRAVVFRIEE